MNKPAGVVSARKDKEHQTVIDLIKPEDQRDGLYPVGRLDRDTEGFGADYSTMGLWACHASPPLSCS